MRATGAVEEDKCEMGGVIKQREGTNCACSQAGKKWGCADEREGKRPRYSHDCSGTGITREERKSELVSVQIKRTVTVSLRFFHKKRVFSGGARM